MTKANLKVLLKGEVELILLHHIADRFVKMNEDSIDVELDTTGPTTVESFLSPTELLATASLIAVVMNVLVRTRTWLQTREWTDARVRDAIKQGLGGEGVKKYRITDIKNLNCLRGEGPCPCMVSAVSTSTGKGYDIHIFLDGTTYTFQITRGPA